MTRQDAKEMAHKIARFNELENTQSELRKTINAIERGDSDGPCGQGPFTSNTRESRKVETIRICFSKTLGGAPAVDMTLMNLDIGAPEFARFLLDQANAKLAKVAEAIEKL